MRGRVFGLWFAGCAAVGLAVAAASCGTNAVGLCDFGECSADAGKTRTDGSAPVDGTTVTEAGNEASAVVEAGCDGSAEPATSSCVVTSTNGIFVAPNGSDTAPGTQTAPVQTIAQGVTLAKQKMLGAVFVCDGMYPAALTFTAADDGVKVYGGFVCPQAEVTNAWSYTGGKATVAPVTAGATALTITGLSVGMTFEDFIFQSTDATGTDANGNGNSSIAVSVNGSLGVVFKRVGATAGAGADGMAGGSEQLLDGGAAGGTGEGPPDASPQYGGLGCSATCPDGVITQGGTGGTGGLAAGANGGPGIPTLLADAGQGGVGQTLQNGQCSDGAPGASGDAGALGVGATTLGSLSDAGWISGRAGGSGTAGATAQAGGGGGGAIYHATPTGGGGGGGCGGCGGGFGTGGGAGGDSIALASVNSGLTLDECTFTASNGGNGGPGGAGQSGQFGGDKGPAAGDGCSGGAGGNGGNGGSGGGGAGGSSFGIAYTGTEPVQDGTIASAGTPGTGGAPGANGTDAGAGAQGVANNAMKF